MANILNIDKVEPTDIEIESSIHYKLNRCRYHKVIRLVQQTKYKNNCEFMTKNSATRPDYGLCRAHVQSPL